MYWNELDGSILFNKVFATNVVISEIDIFEIKIDREATTVVVTFDLINELPDNPPPKWARNYNRCRCGINCSGVSELSLNGISVNMIAKIKIEIRGCEDYVTINGDKISLHLKCAHIQLMGPSVYIDK